MSSAPEAGPSDRGVIVAFVAGDADPSTGPTLHVEGDILYFSGWWQAAFRVAEDAFIVRAESPPQDTTVVADLEDVLRRQGLVRIEGDHGLIQVITYMELSLTGVDWSLWAPDDARGAQALAERVTAEASPTQWAPGEPLAPAGDLSPQLEGARRMVDVPPSVSTPPLRQARP